MRSESGVVVGPVGCAVIDGIGETVGAVGSVSSESVGNGETVGPVGNGDVVGSS